MPKHDHHKAAEHHEEAAKSHRKAAEAHEGRTWVVSEEGTGTSFFLALPRGLRRQYESFARQGSDR